MCVSEKVSVSQAAGRAGGGEGGGEGGGANTELKTKTTHINVRKYKILLKIYIYNLLIFV